MNYGLEITALEVSAQPSWPAGKTVSLDDLSQYTLSKKDLYRTDAAAYAKALKEEYGNGISSLILVYNASGATVTLQPGAPNWHGHSCDTLPTTALLNGQWMGWLHVHSSGAAVGSSAPLVYQISNQGHDVFFGFDTPYTGANRTYTEIRESGHWPKVGSWDYMEGLVDQAGPTSTDTRDGWKSTATAAPGSSPYYEFVISRDVSL